VFEAIAEAAMMLCDADTAGVFRFDRISSTSRLTTVARLKRSTPPDWSFRNRRGITA